MHCGGTVEPWKRTHVHQPRDFISHWKSTANAARGGGQSLVRCVRMWNAKCERAAQPEQQQAQAALRCSAVRSAALQLVVSTPTSSPVEVPAPHHHHKANCRKLPAAMIQLNCLHCAGVRESERERKREMWCMRGWELKSACMCAWMGGSVCECGLCCLILFSLSIALHACKYAIRTHTHLYIHMYWKDRQHQHIRPNWFLCSMRVSLFGAILKVTYEAFVT